MVEYDENVIIGGGEPTIHPKFWEFIGLAIGRAEYVWLATNGKETDIALVLAGLAKRGALGCDLSQDAYHDAIDERVVEAFMGADKLRMGDNDQRGIRDVTNREINNGRCDFGEDGCICPDLVCKPNGSVYACGCDGAPLVGNIIAGFDLSDDWEYSECYKKQKGSA